MAAAFGRGYNGSIRYKEVSMELLQIQNVKKVYTTKLGLTQCVALKNISFTVQEGEFMAIMGASGSGKTTLLNIIASLDRPTAGQIFLNGTPFSSVRDRDLAKFRRENLGFVFQEFNLLDTFSIRDNILLPLVLSQVPVKEMEARLQPVAKMLDIATLLDKFPYEVSGGEKQRAAVARAVITDPQILLADEPTGAWIPARRWSFCRILPGSTGRWDVPSSW